MKKRLSIVLILVLLLSVGCKPEEPEPVVPDMPTAEPSTDSTEVAVESHEKKIVEVVTVEGIYGGIEMGETPKMFVAPHEGEDLTLMVYDEFSPSKLEQFVSHEDYNGLMASVTYQVADIYFEKEEEYKRVLEVIDIELLEALPEVSEDRYALAGFMDAEAFENFFSSLRIFINSDERDHLVELFHYPMTLTVNGEIYNIEDRYGLLENYDDIFDPFVKFTINNQRLDQFMVQYDGVGIGTGQMWFIPDYQTGEKVMISSVNNALVIDEKYNDEAIKALLLPFNYTSEQVSIESIGDFAQLVKAYAGSEHKDSYLENEYLVFKGKIVDYKYDQDRNQSYSYEGNYSLLKEMAFIKDLKTRPTVFYMDDLMMIGALDQTGKWYDNINYGNAFDMRKDVTLDAYVNSSSYGELTGDEDLNVFRQGFIFDSNDEMVVKGYLTTNAAYPLDISELVPFEDESLVKTYVDAYLMQKQYESEYRVKEAYEVDIDGNGSKEVVMNVTSFPESFEPYMSETFEESGFNAILMFKDNWVTPIDEDYYTEGLYTDVYSDEGIYQILDLDNDGVMEIVKESRYFESLGAHVYDFVDGAYVSVVSSYVGP